MARTTYTEDQLVELALTYFQQQPTLRTRGLGPRQYLGEKARALGQLLAHVQAGIKDVDGDIVPGYLETGPDGVRRPRNSSRALDDWAFVLGLPSNRAPGAYGRNGSQAATGGVATPTGAVGTVVGANEPIVDPTSKIALQSVDGFVLPVTSIGIQAVTVGSAGNLPAGTKLRWLSPVAGLVETLVLTTGLTGGYDVEDDLHLAERIILWLQSPPKGGTAVDYRRWAEGAVDSVGRSLGISRAYAFPWRNGVLSVDMVITQSGTGSGRDPGAIKQAQVQAFLDSLRIVTDSVRVLRPWFPASDRFRTRVRGVPNVGYKFDYDDGGVPMTVVSGAAGALSFVINNGTPPARLQTAILNGERPRLQFYTPSLGPIPRQLRAVAFQADTPAPGQCTIQLAAALPTNLTLGDPVYAGGPAVEPVALAVLAEIDSIGPSKQSGYADTVTDSWRAVVAVSALARAALDAFGDDGRKCLSYSQQVGQGVGITFSVNGGAFAGADLQLFDNAPPALGDPQLPECTFIWVTP